MLDGDNMLHSSIHIISCVSWCPDWHEVVSKYNLRVSRVQHYNPTYSPKPTYICNTKIMLSYDQNTI